MTEREWDFVVGPVTFIVVLTAFLIWWHISELSLTCREVNDRVDNLHKLVMSHLDLHNAMIDERAEVIRKELDIITAMRKEKS